MKLFIPTIGQSIRLTADWHFTLYNEYRNISLFKMLNIGAVFDYYSILDIFNKPVPEQKITFPKNIVLTIDRIYIRKGNSDYNSVSFNLNRHPQKQKGRVRFWAKLNDVNGIEFDFRPRLVGDKINFNLDGSITSYGEGVISNYYDSPYNSGIQDCYLVELTKECKEFEVGRKIIVREEEINK